MKSRTRYGRSAIAAAVLLTFAPGLVTNAAAGELDDLKRQIELLTKKIESIEAKQKAAPAPSAAAVPANVVTSGSVPGSIKIPGSDTSFRVSGQVKADYILDLKAPPVGGGGDFAVISTAPLKGTAAANKKGESRFHAKESRIILETFTPTSYGQLKTYIEGDFFDENTNQTGFNAANGATGVENVGNQTSFGIRHAYGELGPFLAGQTWTNFMDITAYGEKVDFTGPAGRTFIRQAQFRYTHTMPNGNLLRVAVENPNGDFNGQTDATLGDDLPDLTANYRIFGKNWHLQANGMLRQIKFESKPGSGAGTTLGTDTATGYGFGLTGSYRFQNRDRVTFYTVAGDGIGRYLEGGDGSGASFNTTTGRLNPQFGYGGFATYQHWWTSNLRSNLVGGVSRFNTNNLAALAGTNTEIDSAYINLIWSPVKPVDVGIEYIWGRREVKDGREGDVRRIQVGTRYKF